MLDLHHRGCIYAPSVMEIYSMARAVAANIPTVLSISRPSGTNMAVRHVVVTAEMAQHRVHLTLPRALVPQRVANAHS
jgi:hypothetical protein